MRHRMSFLRLTICILFLFINLLISGGCERQTPIKIGFVGSLTGKFSDIGIGARDGVILAIEETNKEEGINGRKIKLIIKDDQQDEEIAIKSDKELIKQGVVAIIGHMTSQITISVLPLINKSRVVLISPTTSTNSLTRIDDYFFRVTPPNKEECEFLATYAFKRLGINKISITYDMINLEYSRGYAEAFISKFEAMGGIISGIIPFYSKDNISYKEIANNLMNQDSDAILIIANAMDSALICQHLKLTGSQKKVILSGWAMTDEFLKHGADAIEGAIFSHSFNVNSKTPAYRNFFKKFKDRFGYSPNFASIKGYEASKVIIESLKINPDPSRLKDTILQIGRFKGIDGDFTIDRFGDPKRKLHLITVKDGKFITLE